MTTKEKAEELVKKMYLIHSNSASEITMYFAKQCALIAVDEIIEQESTYDPSISDIRYWQEVKQEIEKL
jgi:hypothetical protein